MISFCDLFVLLIWKCPVGSPYGCGGVLSNSQGSWSRNLVIPHVGLNVHGKQRVVTMPPLSSLVAQEVVETLWWQISVVSVYIHSMGHWKIVVISKLWDFRYMFLIYNKAITVKRTLTLWDVFPKDLINKHIEANTKWPPFRRRHFQMHFLEWILLNYNFNYTEACSLWSN